MLLAALALHFERASRFEPAALNPQPGPLVLDCRDRILRLGADPQGRRVILLDPGPLPEMVAAAFLAAEDARFRDHRGIDPRALARAVRSNLQAGRIVSGASTITQQLARLAYPGPRTYYHKLVEMLRSLRIEAALSKDEILRRYLNLVPQGNNLMGVETAARIYFGKPAAQLTPAEAAVLAALAKAPGSLNPLGPQRRRLVQRRDWVLSRLARLGLLSGPGSRQRPARPASASGPAVSSPLKRRILSTWSWPPQSPASAPSSPHHPGPEPAAPGPGHRPVPPGPAAQMRGLPGGRGHREKPLPGSGGPGGLVPLRPPGPGF